MTKEHNNANLGIISSDSVSEYNAVDILDNFLKVKIFKKRANKIWVIKEVLIDWL